jgi:hypothetical protein
MSHHSVISRLGIALGAVGLALLLALQAGPAGATQSGVEEAPGYLVPLRARDEDTFTRVAPTLRAGEPRTATVTVQYSGFTAEAQAAFQSAVDIWATKVSSSVPIVVQARWEPLGSGILGQAGPTRLYRSFSGAPTNAFYPVPLANKLAGYDINGSEAEIVASFNSSYTNWYLGTDGRPPAGTFDFKTVVLHELGHGFGFIGSMNVSSGSGSCGASGIAFVYDPFVVNGSGQSLTSGTTCPPASSSLGGQLQSGNLYWSGSSGVSAAGGARPRLFAPNPWQPGSSYSHLDESTYPAGNQNSLMTPSVGRAEVIHDPGPITLGMFKDMGWQGAGGTGTAPSASPTPTPSPSPSASPAPTPSPSPTPTPTPSPSTAGPAITDPVSGSTLPGASVTFQWSAASGAQEYALWVGSTKGGAQYHMKSVGLNRTATVTGLPTNGSTVYVRLWWKVSGSWRSQDHTYTAGSGGAPSPTPVPTPAPSTAPPPPTPSPTPAPTPTPLPGAPALTSPTPGSVLGGSSVSFQWSAASGAQEYALWVGSTKGGAQYFMKTLGLSRSAAVSGLPSNGSTVYVRLWWKVNGAWKSFDYTFTAAR